MNAIWFSSNQRSRTFFGGRSRCDGSIRTGRTNKSKEQLVKDFSGSAISAAAQPDHSRAGRTARLKKTGRQDFRSCGAVFSSRTGRKWYEGIMISLEQTENYERDRGPEGAHDDWHDRICWH